MDAERIAELRLLANVAIRDGQNWNDRRLPEMGRAAHELLAALEAAEKERDEWIAQHQELARAEYVGDPAADARVRAAEADRDRITAAQKELADAIQGAKHAAQNSTARAASESDWDSEAYYRAKAEGLQEAENIAREALNPGDSE